MSDALLPHDLTIRPAVQQDAEAICLTKTLAKLQKGMIKHEQIDLARHQPTGGHIQAQRALFYSASLPNYTAYLATVPTFPTTTPVADYRQHLVCGFGSSYRYEEADEKRLSIFELYCPASPFCTGTKLLKIFIADAKAQNLAAVTLSPTTPKASDWYQKKAGFEKQEKKNQPSTLKHLILRNERFNDALALLQESLDLRRGLRKENKITLDCAPLIP